VNNEKLPRKVRLISPSILSADFANLETEVKLLASEGADWIHVDVMDGHFVNNITIGVPVVKSLKKISPLPLDVHLMIEQPEKYVSQFIEAGADILTIHVESTRDPAEVLKRIRKEGARPGITLRPRTSVDEVLPFLPLVDLVLVMTVEPGFGGQAFMQDQLSKVQRLRDEIHKQKLEVLIEADGGINQETIDFCDQVDVIVAGSYVFKTKPYGAQIRRLRQSKF
jgi:ribulose-phosphate 3-epimerase